MRKVGTDQNNPTGYEMMQRAAKKLRKPILARSPVVALRYAWLRTPPSNSANLTQTKRKTYSPYEDGSSVSETLLIPAQGSRWVSRILRRSPASAHYCAQPILPCRGSKHERSQLIERIGKLQAKKNQGCDHQISAQMHQGLIPEILLEIWLAEHRTARYAG